MANNGLEAVELVQSGKYDLILMDMQMPEMGGVEAAEEIRKLGITLPIIAVTANAFASDREMCIQAGMDDFLTKPIKKKLLFEVINKWVDVKSSAMKLSNG